MWKSPTCLYTPPPQPFATVNPLGPHDVSIKSSTPSFAPGVVLADIPKLPQLICCATSFVSTPLIIIFLPLSNNSVPLSIP